MADKGWKAFERRICRDHGVERKPVSGRQTDKHGADNEDHPMFVIQCKLTKALPKWLETVVRGAAAKGRSTGKVGITVVKCPHIADDHGLVILEYRDWRDLHGSLKDVERTLAGDVREDGTRIS